MLIQVYQMRHRHQGSSNMNIGTPLDLSNYATIAPGGVYVIAHPSSDSTILAILLTKLMDI